MRVVRLGHEVWEPLTPDDLTTVLAGASFTWWVAGGWALDLHAGRQLREHADLDVLLLRRDVLTCRRLLRDWDLWAADPPGTLRPWEVDEPLPASVHDIWGRRSAQEPWCLQLMVDDADGPTWRYRRDARVTRPVATLDGPASTAARRVLAPEVQLLYKSFRPRAKDEADLAAVLPHLDAGQRAWLTAALDLVAVGHPWSKVL